MKTSFYFFLWIIIYPLLGLRHNFWIYQNSFIIALFVVWGLSWFLNKNMSATMRYERASGIFTILEEVYTGNVRAFMQRLSRMMKVDFVSAVYLGVAFVFILFSMVRGSADDWVALLIFGFFAFGSITRAVRLNQVYQRIKQNPVPAECTAVVDEIFRVDYGEYYSRRVEMPAETMLPPQPRHFKAFQIFSLVIAAICIVFGVYYLVMSIIVLVGNRSAEAISGGIMCFLYGSLATYFGVRDTINCINYFRHRKAV